jgi:hypothetical protein
MDTSTLCLFSAAFGLLFVAGTCLVLGLRHLRQWIRPMLATPNGSIPRSEHTEGREAAKKRLARLMGPPDLPRELTDEYSTLSPGEERPP